MIKYLSIILLCFGILFPTFAQEVEELQLTLDQVIEMGRGKSPEVVLAAKRLENRDWNYQRFKSQLRPKIGFQATAPALTRDLVFDNIENNYRSVSSLRNSAGFRLDQEIVPTGGNFYVKANLERLDVFGDTPIGFLPPLPSVLISRFLHLTA